MKVTRFLLAIISSILLVIFSIEVYDEVVQSKFHNALDSYSESSLLFLNDSELDGDYVVNTIINLAEKNNVTVHVPFGDTSDWIDYIYTTDQKIIETFILEGNRFIDYSGNTKYSSLSEEYDTRIFKPTKKGSMSVYPLSTYISDNRNVYGEYKLYSENQDDLNAFKKEVNSSFENHNLKYFDVNKDADHYFEMSEFKMNSQSFALLLSIELIMAISIVLSLVRNIKKISILNLEGNSTLSIIMKLVLKEIVLTFVLLPVCAIMGYLIMFSVNKNTFIHQELIQIIFKYYIFLKIIDSIFIILYIFTVSRISVNEGVKGRSNVKLLSSTLYISKIIIIALAISPIISSISYINDFYYGEKNYLNMKENMKNMYKIGGVYAGDAQNLEGKQDTLNEIINEIKKERKAFSYYSFMMFSGNEGTVDIVVDQDYMKYHDIQYPKGIESIIFMKSSESHCQQLKITLEENVQCIVDEKIGEQIVSYSPHSLNNELKGYYPNYAYKDFEVNLSVYLRGLDVDFLVFQDPNNFENAQSYVDNKFIEHGIKPIYNIISLEQEITKDRNIFLYYLKISLATTLLIVIAYVMLTITTYEVELEENKVKYTLELIEGKTKKSFFIRNAFENIPIYVLLILFSYLSNIGIKNMIIIVSVIIVIDIIGFEIVLMRTKGSDE